MVSELSWARTNVEEFLGCALAALLSGIAFYGPVALDLKGEMLVGTQGALFYVSLLILHEVGLRAITNPALHLQQFFQQKDMVSFITGSWLSFVDILGFALGNLAMYKLVGLIDPALSFDPLPPQVGFVFSTYAETVLIEGAILVLLQAFGHFVTPSLYVESAFCTIVILIFLELTGSYSNPSLYLSKMLISKTPSVEEASAYMLGPIIGAAAAMPFLHPATIPEPTARNPPSTGGDKTIAEKTGQQDNVKAKVEKVE